MEKEELQTYSDGWFYWVHEASSKVAYYEGGGAWLKMSKSNKTEMKKMVDTLSGIIIVRQEKADKNSIKN